MVYIETADNSPINVSLEALTLTKKISKENNEQIMAVLIGENLDEAAKKCFDYGADEVLYVEENKKELEAVSWKAARKPLPSASSMARWSKWKKKQAKIR